MTRKMQVLINWPNLTTPEFLVFALNVYTLLGKTGTVFTNLPVTLLVYKAAYDKLFAVYPLRKNGIEAKQAYEDAYNDLNNMTHSIGGHVNVVANGDETIILSAGFLATKGVYSAAVDPGCPGVVKLTQTKGTPLKMEIMKVNGADSYVYMVYMGINYPTVIVSANNILLTTASSVPVMIVTSGNTTELIKGLAPGSHVYVQALAQNAAGKSALGPINDIIIN